MCGCVGRGGICTYTQRPFKSLIYVMYRMWLLVYVEQGGLTSEGVGKEEVKVMDFFF